MDINNKLLDIEYLVFSSHKTATQTVMRSLNLSGIKCLHAHTLPNIDLQENHFNEYLKNYNEANYRKLKIISVFRDPLERIISSFFQSLSEDAHAWVGPGSADKAGDDIERKVGSMSFDELQNLFYSYCECIDGWGESVFIICNELGIEVDKLKFSEKRLIGENDLENCSLYLLRYDLMLPHLFDLLMHITERQIVVQPYYVSGSKWYGGRYIEFAKSLRLQPHAIEKIYESRRSLMNLFYPGQYNSILSEKIRRYGHLGRWLPGIWWRMRHRVRCNRMRSPGS